MNEYEIVEYLPNMWSTLSLRHAQAAFDAWMGERAARVAQLAWLAELPLNDQSDGSLLALDGWLVDRAEPSPVNPAIPDALWRSVARDVGIYIGNVIIARSPWLRWELRTTGPTVVDYREPVIRGFKNVSSDRYEIGPCGTIFRHVSNAINTERRSRVDLGGGIIHEVQLGPVKRDTALRIVKSAGKRA